MSESLGEKQRRFTLYVAQLIEYAYTSGLELTFGEAYRTPEQSKLNAQNGTGISNSLHIIRLAIDLNLFKDGEYQTDSAAFLPLGEWWEKLHPDCRWGGRFTHPDGNHFSVTHEGRA